MGHSASEVVPTMWVVSWNLVTPLILHGQELIQINQYDTSRSGWCAADRARVLSFNALYSHNREAYKEATDTHPNLWIRRWLRSHWLEVHQQQWDTQNQCPAGNTHRELGIRHGFVANHSRHINWKQKLSINDRQETPPRFWDPTWLRSQRLAAHQLQRKTQDQYPAKTLHRYLWTRWRLRLDHILQYLATYQLQRKTQDQCSARKRSFDTYEPDDGFALTRSYIDSRRINRDQGLRISDRQRMPIGTYECDMTSKPMSRDSSTAFRASVSMSGKYAHRYLWSAHDFVSTLAHILQWLATHQLQWRTQDQCPAKKSHETYGSDNDFIVLSSRHPTMARDASTATKDSGSMTGLNDPRTLNQTMTS